MVFQKRGCMARVGLEKGRAIRRRDQSHPTSLKEGVRVGR
jgi:hypothetical protein